MIAALLMMPCVLGAVVLQDEPCGPKLVPMETVTLPNWDDEGQPTDTIQTISVADTETRKIVADYMRPAEFKAGLYPMLGTVEFVNKSGVRRKLRYRQSVRIGDGFVPFFDEGSPLCWEPEKRRVVVYYEETIPAEGSETIDIAWSLTLRKEGQIADINGDCRRWHRPRHPDERLGHKQCPVDLNRMTPSMVQTSESCSASGRNRPVMR